MLIDVSNTDCPILQYCGNLSEVVWDTLFNIDYFILWVLKQSCWATDNPLS